MIEVLRVMGLMSFFVEKAYLWWTCLFLYAIYRGCFKRQHFHFLTTSPAESVFGRGIASFSCWVVVETGGHSFNAAYVAIRDLR